MERAKSNPNRGYYFDFIEFAKNDAVNNTPTTPAISLLFGLQFILGNIAKEGFAARKARHLKTNTMIREWGAKHGFKLFSPIDRSSFALTCFATPETLDLSAFIKTLKTKYNFLINGGYGKVKGTTFRISNMGDETPATMTTLLNALDNAMKQL